MDNVTIKVILDDSENGCKLEGRLTLEKYEEIKNNSGVDPILGIVDSLLNEVKVRTEDKNKYNNIVLGKTYDLDLGGSVPVRVKPVEFTLDGKVKCEYLNSIPGRTEILDIDFF